MRVSEIRVKQIRVNQGLGVVQLTKSFSSGTRTHDPLSHSRHGEGVSQKNKYLISKKDVYLEAIIDLLIIYSQHAVTQDRSFLKSEELKKYSKHVRRNGAGLGRVTLPKGRFFSESMMHFFKLPKNCAKKTILNKKFGNLRVNPL